MTCDFDNHVGIIEIDADYIEGRTLYSRDYDFQIEVGILVQTIRGVSRYRYYLSAGDLNKVDRVYSKGCSLVGTKLFHTPVRTYVGVELLTPDEKREADEEHFSSRYIAEPETVPTPHPEKSTPIEKTIAYIQFTYTDGSTSKKFKLT